MADDETIALRATVIGGQRYADDYQVIWRGLPPLFAAFELAIELHQCTGPAHRADIGVELFHRAARAFHRGSVRRQRDAVVGGSSV